jgi:hypothetical protein
MTDGIACFELPAAIRTDDCIALHAYLCDKVSEPRVVCGSAVKKFSGQAAQLLAAHHKVRCETAGPLTIKDPSDALLAALATLALTEAVGVQA